MKKIKIIYATLAITLLSSCNSSNTSSSNENSIEESTSQQEIKKNYIVLNNFENYKEDVEPISLLNYFGKAAINDDERYVFEGKQSLKIIPEGCKSEGNYKPTLKQPLTLDTRKFDEKDISQYKMITSMVYNSSSSNISLTLALQFFGGYETNYQQYTLKEGWNTIVYQIDSQIVEITYDITNCKGLLYIFDEPTTFVPTLYLDDIRIYKTSEPFQSLDTSVDENEVCSFDKLYQQYVVFGNNNYPKFSPTLEINEDLKYAIKGKSLKVTMPKNDGSFTTYAYTGFSLNSKFIHSVGLDKYDDDKYFSFYVYNTGASQQRLFLELFDYNGVRYYKKTDIYIPSNSWKQVKIKMLDLMSGGSKALTTGNAGEIYINWEINSLTEDRVLYFDEFMIVDE